MHKILVVGGGSIGERHARCLLRTGRAVVSVCDNRQEILDSLRVRYALAGTYPDFASINLKQFDGVLIAAPANLHVSMSRRVLAAGVHLFCEKPLCVTAEGVAELLAEAQAAGVVTGVAFTHRYIHGVCEVKRLLDQGEIGQVRHVQFCVGQYFPANRPAYREIYFVNLKTGGGAILDAGSHLVSAVQWLAGPAEGVSGAYANLGLPDVPVEDTVDAILRLPENVMANIHIDLFGAPPRFLLDVMGTTGALRYCNVTGLLGICRQKNGPWEQRQMPTERDGFYVAEAENFLNAIEGREPMRCSLQEAYHINKVCWAIRQSADEGRWVALGQS